MIDLLVLIKDVVFWLLSDISSSSRRNQRAWGQSGLSSFLYPFASMSFEYRFEPKLQDVPPAPLPLSNHIPLNLSFLPDAEPPPDASPDSLTRG